MPTALDLLQQEVTPLSLLQEEKEVLPKTPLDAPKKIPSGQRRTALDLLQEVSPVQPLPGAELRPAPPETFFESATRRIQDITSSRAKQAAKAQITFEANQAGLSTEEYEDILNPPGKPLRRVQRFGKGVLGGAIGTLESMAGSAEWLSGGELGSDLAKEARVWREELAPDEPDFSDQLASGLGSAVTFFIPGFGVSKGAQLLSGVAPRAAAWLGSSVAGMMEAATEAGGVYREIIQKTKGDREKAEEAASSTFMWNIPVNILSNKLGALAEAKRSPLKEAFVSGPLEGLQEGLQEIVSSHSKGEEIDWAAVRDSAAVGAITGGAIGGGEAALTQRLDSFGEPQPRRITEGLAPPGATREELIKANELDADFVKLKKLWIGEKDRGAFLSRGKAMQQQQAIRESVGEKKFGKLSKDIDKAIHVFIDLKRNPDHLTEFFDDLTPEQQRIVELSQNLTPQQQQIASQIEQEYQEIGRLALDNDLIRNTLDNYVGRIWNVESPGRASELQRKFGTKTRHAKSRTFDTIIQGWATKDKQGKPFTLKVQGATNNLNILKEEINKTVQDKNFLELLSKMRNLDGDPLITTDPNREGYVRVEHPNMKLWRWAGNADVNFITEMLTQVSERRAERVEAGVPSAPVAKLERVITDALVLRGFSEDEASSALRRVKAAKGSGEAQTIIREIERDITQREVVTGTEISPIRGRNFFLNEQGVALEKRDIFAPKGVAKDLNNILGVSKLRDTPGAKQIARFNAIAKRWKLQSSFFHHLAYTGSFYLGSTPFKNAFREMKSGEGFISAIKQLTPRGAYRAGLKAYTDLNPELEMLVANGLTLGRIQDWEESIINREDALIDKVLDETKASKLVKDKMKAFRQAQEDFLFKQFGTGLKAKAALIEFKAELKRPKNKGVDPNIIAERVADLMNDDFGGLHLARIGRDPDLQHIFKLFFLAPDWTESNVRSMVKAFNRGEEGEIYRRFWARIIMKGAFATLAANALLHGDELPEVYNKALKEGRLRFADVDITPIYKAIYGSLGLKQSGARKWLSLFQHFKDPLKFSIEPMRSLRYKASPAFSILHDGLTGKDWAERQFTSIEELLATGQTVRPPFTFAPRPRGITTVPSFVLNKVKDLSLPVQGSEALNWWAGESEAFEAIGRSAGLRVGTSFVRTEKQKKELRAIRKAIRAASRR